MSVSLRWKKNTNGSKTAYLDIYQKGAKRRKKYIGIRIDKSDKKRKEKKELAEAIRTKFHNDVLNKKFDLVSEDKMESDFILYYQNFLVNHKKAGIRKYRYAYEKFLVYLKSKDAKLIITKSTIIRPYSIINTRLTFNELDISVCQSFKDYLYSSASKLKGETPYDYFKRFKAVVNKAYKERYLIENPSDEVEIKKPENSLKKQILTQEEMQILANTHCGNSEVKRAFLFSCFTGLGVKEIRLLKWADVANDRLNTNRAKNQKKISSKLSTTAKHLLGEKGPSNNRIFTLPSDTSVNKTISNWLKRADIDKHITFYCGRHSFAILNLKNGANLKTISKLMGHASTVPTNKYLNYLDEQKDEAMDNLPELQL